MATSERDEAGEVAAAGLRPIPEEGATMGPVGSTPARYASRLRLTPAGLIVERHLGTVEENTQTLFRQARILSEFFLASGLVEREPFIVAREDLPMPDHRGLRSLLLLWVPGGGFAFAVGHRGHYEVREVYRTPQDMRRGMLPTRLVAAAARNLSAEDSGERLVRFLENSRRLRELGIESGAVDDDA
jgi:hypothetical protein